jgi:hypothetical protein
MKGILALLVSFFSYLSVCGQNLKFVQFSNGTDLVCISYITDQNVIIKISTDGKILEWGYEQEPGRFYGRPGMLKPYMGRVEYYSNQTDSILNGKVRYIGTTSIYYYGSSEKKEYAGKIKMLGRNVFDYFAEFDNESFRGKIKAVGDKSFNYYNSFENEAYRGKLKQVGSSNITYFSTFEDKALRGKLKTIGSVTIGWYNSLERYPGSLKDGIMTRQVDGVTYIL